MFLFYSTWNVLFICILRGNLIVFCSFRQNISCRSFISFEFSCIIWWLCVWYFLLILSIISVMFQNRWQRSLVARTCSSILAVLSTWHVWFALLLNLPQPCYGVTIVRPSTSTLHVVVLASWQRKDQPHLADCSFKKPFQQTQACTRVRHLMPSLSACECTSLMVRNKTNVFSNIFAVKILKPT